MNITAIEIARRFFNMKEIPGVKDNPFIVWCLSTCNLDTSDETPWCSAFVNGICYILGLENRSNSAWARSWLMVGTPVELEDAKIGWDICIFQRGTGQQGHVGFYAGLREDKILILGGNQADSVSVMLFGKDKLLGVRRLLEE
jgi:uncharacterized protein (TIGR02594 family)